MSRFPNMATVKNADRNDPAPKIAINHWILQFHTHVRVAETKKKNVLTLNWVSLQKLHPVFRLKSVCNKYFICEIKDVSAIEQAQTLFNFGAKY